MGVIIFFLLIIGFFVAMALSSSTIEQSTYEESANIRRKKYLTQHYQTKRDIAVNPAESSNTGEMVGHNMSFNKYKITAKYKETKRYRGITVAGINEKDALNHLPKTFENDVKNIELIPYATPSKKQLNYARDLGIRIPHNVCIHDVSGLLDEVISIDSEIKYNKADSELVNFALKHRVVFSYYYGECRMIGAVLNQFSNTPEKIAFIIACKYKSKYKKWDFKQWENWIKCGEELMNDERFISAMDRTEFIGFESALNYTPPGRGTVFYKMIQRYVN